MSSSMKLLSDCMTNQFFLGCVICSEWDFEGRFFFIIDDETSQIIHSFCLTDQCQSVCSLIDDRMILWHYSITDRICIWFSSNYYFEFMLN